jgi:DNA-directed RNA polymerase specialized sigma24 family protein
MIITDYLVMVILMRKLTKKQEEVIKHFVDGFSVEETARLLEISTRCVAHRMFRARRICKAKTTVQLVAMYVRGEIAC